jgi:hypothetical protein
MKPLEDAFASDIFRRVVLPGIVLSVGLHPLLSQFTLPVEHLYGLSTPTLIVAEVIVLGLGISSAIQPIYYVYEGFRLGWLTTPAWKLNRWRLARRWELALAIQGDRDFDDLDKNEQSRLTKVYEYISDFPLIRQNDGSTEYKAERPTRLGNIIATYERYAETRYHVDGIAFWYHFLNLASDTSRKAFEEKYSFAESMVLTSFAGALVAALHLLVLVGFWIGRLNPLLILVHLSTGLALSAWMTAVGLTVWLLFYRASLPAHREAGTALRAIVDSVFPQFVAWAATMQFTETDIERIEKLGEYLKRPDN